jgi:hypothetical protein
MAAGSLPELKLDGLVEGVALSAIARQLRSNASTLDDRLRVSLAAISSQRLRGDVANLSVFIVCDNQSHPLEPSGQGQTAALRRALKGLVVSLPRSAPLNKADRISQKVND